MSALRLARGFTGRRMVVKFAGCYHGHVDALLAAAGSGVATLALPDTPGVTGAGGRGHDRPALQRPRGAGRGVRSARPRRRLRDHRGRRREHGGGPADRRVLRGAAVADPPARRPADLRRGDDRFPGLSLGLVGPAGRGRRDRGRRAGPVHLRQGDGRRLPGGGVRRPGRRDGPARAGRSGLPGRHAVREPGGDRRRAGHPARLHPGALPAPGSRRGPADRRRRAALGEAGVPHVVQRAGSMFSVFFTRRPGLRLRRGPDAGPDRLRARSSTPCSSGACTCRRARSRPGSCPPPTTTRRSTGCWRRSPPLPRRRRRRRLAR